MKSLTARLRGVSFRTRVVTLVAVALGVTVALAAAASYYAVKHQLYDQVDSSLVGDLGSANHLVNSGSNLSKGIGTFLHSNDDSYLQILYIQNGVLSTLPLSGGNGIEPNASQGKLLVDNPSSPVYDIEPVTYQGVRYRVITESGLNYQISFFPSETVPAAIQIFRPLTDIDHSLSELRLILWLVGFGGIAVAVGLAYVIGRATLRPVAALTAAAEHVAATQDLDATIETSGDDELARLARSFNSMLSALAASRQQQAQLISDAGHELRTPLTSLRTNMEVLMRVKDLPAVDREELVEDVQAQLEEMTTLIGDVVDLARSDEKPSEPIEVRLDTIVARAVERAGRRAPAVLFDTELTAGSVVAHPALLERAVLNVLDNAAKWSPPGGHVTVRLLRTDRWLLDVRDQGPGIAAEDLPHIFDRFYRAESARSMAGSGLGLAIVRNVVTDLNGSVQAAVPSDGGAVIRIELPIVAESEPELEHDGEHVLEAATPPSSEISPGPYLEGAEGSGWGQPAGRSDTAYPVATVASRSSSASEPAGSAAAAPTWPPPPAEWISPSAAVPTAASPWAWVRSDGRDSSSPTNGAEPEKSGWRRRARAARR